MRIPRIYLPAPLGSGQTVTLDNNAFNHAVRVLRLKEGAPLVLFNGEGGEFEAILSEVQKRHAIATVGTYIEKECESPLHIILGQCISRGEKMDYTIQKAVELGVNEIVPLFSERCGVKLQGDRLEKREQHWQSVAISACEQSGRNRIPSVVKTMSYSDWIKNISVNTKFILDPRGATSLKQLPKPQGSIALVMGPEGGLDDSEIGYALQSGFTALQLGPRILRTETAALTTISAIQALWGDLA